MTPKAEKPPISGDLVVVTDAWETDEWYESDYGHEVPAGLWAEWKAHYARLIELADQFSKCPRVDNRPRRELTENERRMHFGLIPQLHYDQLADIKLTNDDAANR